MKKTVFRCKKCKDTNVECTAWLNMNTDEIVSSGNEGPLESCWCPTCEDDNAQIEEVLEEIEDNLTAFIHRQPKEMLEALVYNILTDLYLDQNDWNIDKEWDSGTIELVAARFPEGVREHIRKLMKENPQ